MGCRNTCLKIKTKYDIHTLLAAHKWIKWVAKKLNGADKKKKTKSKNARLQNDQEKETIPLNTNDSK